MTETPQRDPLEKALKSLTIAVWCLCALVVVQLALYAAVYVRSMRFFRGPSSSPSGIGSSPPRVAKPIPGEPITSGTSFHELPPEEMVKKASAILLTQWRKVDGEPKLIVTEILKHRPGTTLYYSVGDEYELGGGHGREYVAGDGNVVFLEDSPASARSSYSYEGGRVGGLAEMPLAKLRELARSAK
jgi:hypothetical protein